MHEQTKLDALARVLREIADSERNDPRLEGPIGDDEAYEEWGRGVGALHLLGKLEPWGGQVLEVCVKFAGTYRPHPAMDPVPGVPAHYLCNGGPDGTYKHLRDKSPTPAFWKRLNRLCTAVNKSRGPRLRFYLKQVNKSATGFRGLQTAAFSSAPLSMPAISRLPDDRTPPITTGSLIRFRRDPK
jgi:hypothetical protein